MKKGSGRGKPIRSAAKPPIQSWIAASCGSGSSFTQAVLPLPGRP